jgi:hypothetical protein
MKTIALFLCLLSFPVIQAQTPTQPESAAPRVASNTANESAMVLVQPVGALDSTSISVIAVADQVDDDGGGQD